MRQPTKEDVDALVGPATPHFAYQLRARLEELVLDLPEGHPVKRYAKEKMELLDRLGHASSKAEEGLRNAGAEPVLVRGNVSSEKIVGQFASQGPWDSIVHNAATGVVRTVLETEDKHWDWTLNANARALLSLARACATDMKPGSSIVGVSSLGSTRVPGNYVLLGPSQAAL